MKAVNKTSAKILDTLTNGLDFDTDCTYRKLNKEEGSFMAVSIECINKIRVGNLISIAHYYEQNSDLMADPEMIFIKAVDGNYYPIYIKMAGTNYERYSVNIEDGEIKTYNPRQQKDDATFANTWMRNIKQQQGLKPSTVL